MASTDEIRLLSLIESSGADAGEIFDLFSDHLRSFSGLPTSRKQDQTLAVRSLTKQFLPFLNKALSLFPKRLSAANADRESRESARIFFQTYELCLDCLELVSVQLTCKPHTIQLLRLRLIQCLQAWGLYTDAYNHAFKVLDKLRGSNSSSRKRRWLPEVEQGEAEMAMVVVEAVGAVCKCVAKGQERDSDRYRTVLLLLNEVKPWFRVLDANAYERLHRVLVTNMGICTLTLVREVDHFDEDLVHSFCKSSLQEYFTSPFLKARVYKFAREMLSILFALKESKISLRIHIAMSVLQTVACELKAETNEGGLEFLNLVSYCAHKFQGAESLYRATVSKHLSEISAIFSEAIPRLTLRFYSTGLYIGAVEHKFKEGDDKKTTDDQKIQTFFNDEDRWQNLASLLSSTESFLGEEGMQADGKLYGLPFVDALKFLCQPLAELINSVKRKIVLETEISCDSAHLCVIQDAFLQYCDGCLFLQRSLPDKGDSRNEHNATLLNVSMAAFILSLRTQHKMKISVHIVESVISSPRIRSKELKHLFVSFYNIGVDLYRNKQLDKACKALKLCFRASWTCVGLLCQMFVNTSNSSEDCPVEESIIDFVGEACSRCAFYLDTLQQCRRHKIKKTIVSILEHWSAAEGVIKRLPVPIAIIRQWVKMECRARENQDQADSCTTMYSLLSSSQKLSKRTIGKILEQELLAYEERLLSCSNRSKQVLMDISDILLKDFYVTEDMDIERASVLVCKARLTRASGTEHLRDCIHYLSEAISILGDKSTEPTKQGPTSCHLLPVAYCLRALCIQEAEPNSKQVLQDISTSLNLMLRIPNLDDCNDSMPLENIIPLLYNIIDLLSMKGCTELHHHLYQLLFKLHKRKNVRMEVCVAMLWECRRLSHALCPSPISDAFILNLSEYCIENIMCVDFWMNCLKDSKARVIGFKQNFLFLDDEILHISNKYEGTFRSDITIDDVKKAASELISNDPPPSHSAFVAAYLYYDLCEKLISYGRFSEALSCAREAHRIRNLSFQEKFKYTSEKQYEKHNNAGNIIEIRTYSIKQLEVFKSIATDFWPRENSLWDINHCYLSPWNVLQCYLESTLQCGVVNELIGNGAEAETLLLWGKSISCSQSLSPFIFAFSSALGNLYCKKQNLDIAANELQNAKELLIENRGDFSCLKCRLKLEVTLDKQLGDLSRKQIDSGSRASQIDGLSHAESLFSAAFSKISCSALTGCISCHAEANAEKKVPPANRDTTRGQKARLSKDNASISKPSSRVTRSMRQSLKEQSQSCSVSMSTGVSKKPTISVESDLPDAFGICICDNSKCQKRQSDEEMNMLSSLVRMKWEFCYRRLACNTLVSLGKCLSDSGKVHQAHETLLLSISVLLNSYCYNTNSPSVSQLLDFIRSEFRVDVFAVERAAILYKICWLSLWNYHSRESRSLSCELMHIPLSNLVSGLKLAFVISREVPILFQKVSRLLAALYLLAASSPEFSFQCDGDELFACHWASFFHQASIGTHISFQFFSNLSHRLKSQCHSDKEATGSCCDVAERLNLPRLAPESTQDLLHFVKDFFNNFSSPAVICISLLGGALGRLLQDLMQIHSPVSAWLLLSRLNSKSQPVAVLQPVVSVLEDDTGISSSIQVKDSGKQWQCPWGSTVVDEVAPAFKSILEENYISSSNFSGEETKESRCLWWKTRTKLDRRLGEFLRNLEDSWLGPWKHLLLGEMSYCKLPDPLQKKLVNDLRSKCKMEVNETFLRIILGGGTEDFKGEACIAQLCLKNGCYVGKGEYFDEEDSCRTPTATSNISESRHGLALQLIHEAATKLEQQEVCEDREPTILVLDPEAQMLPWENIPILRRHEVYRMPSVGSIFAVMNSPPIPLIDPFDSFYLLNPGGDLVDTQVEFESWFRDQNMEGKAGSVPTSQELTEALKKHDLFVYFGHGSGSQYISKHEIENLEKCAATFLMGCSSGSWWLKGSYIPHGISLSYLLAGSPAVVANLWDVTDKDINRFGKAMLEAWLRERSDSSSESCDPLVDEFAAMEIKGRTRKPSLRKKPVSGKKRVETNVEGHIRHRRKIGSFMAGAREACTMKFLIGAAPVCYGVPTGITRKKDLKQVLLPQGS